MEFSPSGIQVLIPEVQQSKLEVKSLLKLDHNCKFQKRTGNNMTLCK